MRTLKMADRRPSVGPFLIRSLRHWVPRSRGGDAFFSLVKFLKRNRRWPRKSGGDFNDFLFYLKNSRSIESPLVARVTCKLGLRDHVKEVLGEAYCVPLLAVLETQGQVAEHAFPESCAIKPSHLSGEIILRRRGEALDRERIASWLRRDYYQQSRERNYRSVKPRVLVEPLLPLDGDVDLKVTCFRGEPKAVAAFKDVTGANLKYRYTLDWQLADRDLGPSGKGPEGIARPAQLEDILRVARILAKPFLFVRVDFLLSGGRVRVGELTSVPASAGLRIADRAGWEAYNRLFFGEKGFHLSDYPELRP